MIKTFKYRIYPTKRQAQVLNEQLAVCCELYNAALKERREAWRCEQRSISYFDQTLQLTQIKPEREDVAAINANVLENVLKRAHLAFAAFFRRVKNGEKPGYPRFRSVLHYDSLTYRQRLKTVLQGSRLRLRGIGKIRIRLHRPLTAQPRTLTIKREANKWFAVFSVDVESVPLPFCRNAVGIDVGLRSFATLSDGSAITNPRWFRAAAGKLRRLQRRVARRNKGSNRRRKAVLLLQRFHNHVRDQRRDFHHKESRRIVNASGLIAVEDLNVKGLARGMLAKSVNDAGWSNFLFMLAYKAESAGRVFVKVDPSSVVNRLCEHPACESFDIQVLDGDQSVCVDNLARFFVMKIPALIADVVVESLKQQGGFASPVRDALPPRHAPLQTSEFPLRGSKPARTCNRGSVAEHRERIKPNINADHVRSERQRVGLYLDGEEGKPTSSLSFDRECLNCSVERAMQVYPYLTDPRQPQPISLQGVPDLAKGDAVITPRGSESWITRLIPAFDATEERPKGKMDAFKRILQHVAIYRRNVFTGGLDFGQLNSLIKIRDRLALPRPCFTTFLQGGVVKLAAYPKLVTQQLLLSLSGVYAITEGLDHAAILLFRFSFSKE